MAEAIAETTPGKPETIGNNGGGSLDRFSTMLSEKYPDLRFNTLTNDADGSVSEAEARYFLELTDNNKTPRKKYL